METGTMERFCYYVFPLILSMQYNVIESKVFDTLFSQRVVTTQYGKLRGFVITLPNKDLRPVEAFFGLSYASVLNGDLRFMPPTGPMDKWSGIRSAMKQGPACPQRIPKEEELERKMPLGRAEQLKRLVPFIEQQDEECLNLNVYMPQRGSNETSQLPVLMFVHGESYELGTGNAYDGSVLASYGNVVVVTLNYRLGPLGFLTTGDSRAPGNLALLDLVAAMHWIRGNIGAFGGDPNQVTLLGQGHGGALVNLLLISPLTKGKNLFQRAIIQSGSALGTWAICNDPLRYTRELAHKVNCSHFWGNTEALVKCLKSKPAKELVNAEVKSTKYYPSFGPYIDKRSILTQSVEELIEKSVSVFGNTDLLLGVMKNEGFLFFSQNEVDEGINEYKRNKIVRTYIRNIYEYHRQKIFDILLHHYSDHERPLDPLVIRDTLMDLIGDGQVVAPSIHLSQYHATHVANTFLYTFNYPTRLDSYPRWAGGVHGDDLVYVFGAPLTEGLDPFPTSFSKGEKMLSEAIITYWTNFARSGNPNEPNRQATNPGTRFKNRFIEFDWPEYDNDDQKYLHIGMRPSVRHHYRSNKMALWLDLIPKLHRSDNLSPDKHRLSNYNNVSTFEDEGTKPFNQQQIFVPPPIPPTPPPSVLKTSPRPKRRTPTAATHVEIVQPVTRPKRPTTVEPIRIIKVDKGDNENPASQKNGTVTAVQSGTSDKSSQLSLSVIIAVGCSLLLLNILIFAGVYYQRDRMKMEMKMKHSGSERDQSVKSEESEPLKGVYTDQISDTNSFTPPPTAVVQISKHQVQPASTPTHPIPIPPPQPPYYARNHNACNSSERNSLLGSPRTRSHRVASPRHVRLVDTHEMNLKHSSSDSGADVQSGNRDTVV